MPFNITVQDVEVSKPEGKKYFQAKVTYTYKGTNRSTNLPDFANPQVFKDIQNLKGQEVTVETTKNSGGFDVWAKVYPVGSEAATPRSANPPAQAQRASSTYETADERAARQLLIVKQSSLSAAVATLAPGSKGPLDPATVVATAQGYVDWVMGVDKYLEKSE